MVVRPDGYVSLLVEMEDMERIDGFFAGCMLPAQHHHTGRGDAGDTLPAKHVGQLLPAEQAAGAGNAERATLPL